MTATVTEGPTQEHIQEVGEQVRAQMGAVGLDPKTLGAKLGCSHQTIRNALDGKGAAAKWRPLISKAIGWSPSKFGALIENEGMAQTALAFSDKPAPAKVKKKPVSPLKTTVPVNGKKVPMPAADAPEGPPVWKEPKVPDLPAHYGPVRVENAVLKTRVDALEAHLVQLTKFLHEKLG